MKFFFFLYRWLIWPLLRFAFGVLATFNSKIREGLELRKSVGGRAPWIKGLPPSTPTIWIHASSGEFEYAKPVITRFKQREPAAKIVVTYFSPTYVDNIRKFAGVDWVVPLPWDSPTALNQFMDSYRPSVLLVARTDVWPEMARQVRLRGMKSLLFSATLTAHSGRTRGVGRWATRATLEQLDAIFTVTEEDALSFRSLGLLHPTIEVRGDTRYDQVLARLESPKPIREDLFSNIALALGGRDVFVCGSTWPEDEDVLVPALQNLKNKIVGCLVPHEPTAPHLEKIETLLAAHDLMAVRYSDPEAAEKIKSPNACLVIDQVGILAELYLKARFAFIGGSFRKTVHSVMEPLGAGCLTFVGPLHTNNREAVSFQKHQLARDLRFVTVVHDARELTMRLQEALELADFKSQVRDEVRTRTGATERVVNWTLQEIEGSGSQTN